MRLDILCTVAASLLVASTAFPAERIIKVSDDASLHAALRKAQPGTRIQIAPGRYRPGVYVSGLTGTEAEPIVIEGADEKDPPLFEGGGEALHFPRCAYLTLRNIAVRGQSSNGINIDDGGVRNKAAHHVVLEKIRVSDVGPRGNHDAIKLSGLDDFVVRGCTFEGWGGQAPDMVGCHRGLIEDCTYKGKPGVSSGVGPQIKGGSSQVTVRRCLFLDSCERGVNMGGSTGPTVFRPQGAKYEAKDVVVEGCTFVGCEAAVAYISCGAIVRYNTIYRPSRWALRILKEDADADIPDTSDGRFEHNLVIFRRAQANDLFNVGPHTRPETFRFANNWWYCEDAPAVKPKLPVAETGGVYGTDPQLAAPERNDFRPLNAKAAAFGALAWKPE
jgi:hypothetical protein